MMDINAVVENVVSEMVNDVVVATDTVADVLDSDSVSHVKKKRKKTSGEKNCCFPTCHMNSVGNKDISFFLPTTRKGEFYETWNKNIYDVILRHRGCDS